MSFDPPKGEEGSPEDPGVRAEVVRALRRWVIRVETHEAHLDRRLQGYEVPSTTS